METILQFLLGGAAPGQVAICILLAVVLVWISVRGLVNAWPWLARAVAAVNAILTLSDDMAIVKHELQHNGGGSVKDAVARTEKAVAELSGKLSAAQSDVSHVKRQAASLKTSIGRTNRRLTDYIDRHP